MGDRSRAVVSVIGRDQKGVVARVSTYLAAANVNIEDIEQRVMEGLFIMTMLVDLSDLATTLDDLVFGLRRIGDEINMEVTVRLAGGPPTPKRVAVLVTREPHCLEQLIAEREAGKLNGELVVVVSNHADLEPLARQHGIPFAWSPSTDNSGSVHYQITVSTGENISVPNATTTHSWFLVASHRYTFTIRAIDPSGNRSGFD